MGAALPFPGAGLWLSLAAVSAASGAFAWRQNRGGVVGGPISAAKALWLNLALIFFFALPCALWLDPALHPSLRTLFGTALLSFVLRGGIELYVIYATRAWRCSHGIGHDFFTLALALLMRAQLPAGLGAADARALLLLDAYQLMLVVEAFFAWSFGRVADPATGVYFADESQRFRTINRLSWAAVAAGYSFLAYWLWAVRHDF